MGITVRHILKHPSGGRTYRRAFPPALRPYVGRREHKVPLGLEGSSGFLARYEAAAAEYDQSVARARKAASGAFDPLTPELAEYLACAYRTELLTEDEEVRWVERPQEVKYRAARRLREGIEEDLAECRALRAAGDLRAIVAAWGETASGFAEARDYTLDAGTEAFRQLCRLFNDANVGVWETILARLDGQDVPTPPEPISPLRSATEAAPRVPLLATFDAYAAAQGITAGVRDEWRRCIAGLGEFLGHDDAARLTSENVMDWRSKLLSEPTKRGTLREPRTVRGKYITAIRATLAWAVEEKLLPRNVAADIVVRVPKKAKLRERDFTTEEAKSILKATLLPPSRHLSRGHALARRWVPWLCAYTGARVNEFSQIRGKDVQEIEGIWTVRITPEAGTVKAKEARIIPLHPHLIEQGFLDMVRAHGPGPLFYDPDKQRVRSGGNRHFKKVGERLAQWVRKDVGINDPAIQPNHAWRHTFKTRGYLAGMEERVADAIQGHAPKTTGRTYGKPPLKALAEAIAKLPRFEIKEANST